MTNQLRSPLRSSLRSPFEHRRGGAFNPASLSPSAFYDRTVLSTLFQDSAGTTPVTAGSQLIGLGLDQSQGLELGPELMTNYSFDSGGSGWIDTGSAWSFSGGKAIGTAVANGESLYQNQIITAGEWHRVVVDIESIDGDIALSLGGVYMVENCVVGVNEYTYLATSSGNANLIGTASTGNAVVNSFSVKLLAGNHQSQATAGKRPLTAGSPIYADFDAVDDDIVTTFPTSLGAGCTVCRSLPATGASITTGVTIGTTFTDNVDAHALLIFTAAQWAALSAGDITNLTAWLNKKAGL